MWCDKNWCWSCRGNVVCIYLFFVCFLFCENKGPFWYNGDILPLWQSSTLLAHCEGNPPVTGGFLSQRASNAGRVSMLRPRHAIVRIWINRVTYNMRLPCITQHTGDATRGHPIHGNIIKPQHILMHHMSGYCSVCISLTHYTPAQRSWRGGILDSPCPSVCPSVRPSVRPSVCRRHGFRSISQVCFGISISNFICMLMVAISRSLLIFRDVTFKMAAWQPYWIFLVSGL